MNDLVICNAHADIISNEIKIILIFSYQMNDLVITFISHANVVPVKFFFHPFPVAFVHIWQKERKIYKQGEIKNYKKKKKC